MQQLSRLDHPLGSDGGRAGPSASVPPSPSTPRKDGKTLSDLISSLEEQHHLGFNVSNEPRSRIQKRSAADAVANKIQWLFFSDTAALHDALVAFGSTATFIPKTRRLDALSSLLRSKTQHVSPMSRKGTPLSSRHLQQNSLKNPPSSDNIPRSRGLFDNWINGEKTSLHIAIPDPRFPTNEVEDDFATPASPTELSSSPSPSMTSKSAKRVEASIHISLQSISLKRPSDTCIDKRKPKKLTKSSKGDQPFPKPQVLGAIEASPSYSKRPSLETVRSFGALPVSQSTVDTSFNTVTSSPQIQPDTANTSFTSDANHAQVSDTFMPRKSSATIESLTDQAFLTVNAKLSKETVVFERRAQPFNSSSLDHESSSHWDLSIPKQELLEVSARVESLNTRYTSSSEQLLLPRRGRQSGNLQLTLSPVKNDHVTDSKLTAASLGMPFPPPPGAGAILSPDNSVLQPRSVSNGVALTGPQQRFSREDTPIKWPPKISHHIRDIFRQSLFVPDPPPSLQAMPYFALFICQRIALERSISLEELTSRMDVAQACADPKVFWNSLLAHPTITHIKFKDPERLWSSAERSYEGFTFKGQIHLRSKRSGPVFRLDLHPILPEKSCRFQRKFGADRFLYLNVPDLDAKSCNGATQDDLKLIRECWKKWLLTEHTFLNRTWRVFHIGPLKKAKTKGRNAEVTHRFRIVLFATRGCGIATNCTVRELLNWFFPLAQNLNQTICKAYARFDLGLSRTTPTLVFRPSQVKFVPDTLANHDREATEFNDPYFQWKQMSKPQVMNDGCALVSVGAAREIWKLYRKAAQVTGPLPSAFQGRIGGAKGLWMVSGESFTKNPKHLAIWIEVTKKQLKFEPHPEDVCDTTFDPLRLTFEVSNYSTTPTHSDLHISFIPIMTDRGVPRRVIAELMQERLDADRRELVERVKDPVKLYEYVHKNSSISREGSDMRWQAALPLAREENIKLLLESGFSPLELPVLAKHVSRFVMKQQLHQESRLKTTLGKATYLYGAADPLGVLRPGEVHVQFSSSFVDELTDQKYLNLKGHNLLVARQPAIRNSDMQKVRAVLHPQLSHLVDVLVFPSKGQYPLAGKLQGGDYDGDMFWICWEDRLVAPFRNAPAPVESPDPEQYGIKVDRDTLEDLRVDVNDELSIDEFLQKAFVFRSAESLLGKVTTFFEKQSYLENRLSSSKLDRLADMHDLLADAAKDGYTFTEADWRSYLRNELECVVPLSLPVYREAMNACARVHDFSADVDNLRQKKYIYKAEHVVDYLYFEIVRSHNITTMKEIQVLLSSATKADADLLYPCQQLSALKDPVIDKELRRVQEEMQQIYLSWNKTTHKDDRGNSIDDFARVVEGLYVRFTSIKPIKTDHPMIKSWLHPWLRAEFRLWDRLRASILYAKLPAPNAQTFVFQMAGDELARIKAEKFAHTRYMIADIRAKLRPKPTRAPAKDADDDGDDDDTDKDEDVAEDPEQGLS